MNVSKKQTKPMKRQLVELIFFATIVAMEIFFINQINLFLNTALDLVSDHHVWLMFSTFFIYVPIILMPFGLLFHSFERLSSQIQSEFSGLDLLKSVILLHVVGAVYASCFWLLKSEGILNAIIVEMKEMNYLLLGLIVVVSYNVAKELTDPVKLANVLKVTICICFIWIFYFWFGLDDGCTSSGGDGLFTSGEKDCDPDYIKAKEALKNKGVELGFNSNAGFAAQYLWMVGAGFVTTLTVYFVKNRNV